MHTCTWDRKMSRPEWYENGKFHGDNGPELSPKVKARLKKAREAGEKKKAEEQLARQERREVIARIFMRVEEASPYEGSIPVKIEDLKVIFKEIEDLENSAW
jgi:hypothetical protein